MDPSLLLVTAPLGAASTLGNLLVLSLALRDAFDATHRICADRRVFHSVLTANQALAALLFGAAHIIPPFDVDTAALVDATTLAVAFSIALVALHRAACVSPHALPVPATTQRRRASVVVGAFWIIAFAFAMAPISHEWRPIVLALAQFAAPTLALLTSQACIALRLRSRRRAAKTNALLTLSMLHFVLALAPPTVALALSAPQQSALTVQVPAVVAAAVSPLLYGWLSKPIRKRSRRLADGVVKLWSKGGKITEKRRLSLKSGARKPQVFIVALPGGTNV